MEEYSRIKVQEMSKLALPNGLKDLMADISREILRAQPVDLHSFIAAYLRALLKARESLCIASKLCCDICNNITHPPLDDALKSIGLSDEDVATVIRIVAKVFEASDFKGDQVKETHFFAKMIRQTEINEEQIDDVIDVIRRTYLRHKLEQIPERTFKCLGFPSSISTTEEDELAFDEVFPAGSSHHEEKCIKFGATDTINDSDISIIKRQDLHSPFKELSRERKVSEESRNYSKDSRKHSGDSVKHTDYTKSSDASKEKKKISSPQRISEESTDRKEVEVNEVDYKVSIDKGDTRKEFASEMLTMPTEELGEQESVEEVNVKGNSGEGLKTISFHDKDQRIVYDAANDADDESNNSSIVDESITPESVHDDDRHGDSDSDDNDDSDETLDMQ